MMKTNVILAAIAGVLAIPTAMTLIDEGSAFTDFDTVPHLFEGFTDDNIAYITMSKAKPPEDGEDKGSVHELIFVRQEDHWFMAESQEHPNKLAGVPLQGNKIQKDILDHMKAIRLDGKALVEEDAPKEQLEARGLTDETGILIRCLNAQQQPLAELYRGNDASGVEYREDSVSGFYVRQAADSDVILYEPNPSYWYLTVKGTDWIDTTIHNFQGRNVVRFSVTNPKGEVAFVRGDKNSTGDERRWRMESGPEGMGAVRQQEVANLMQRFTSVSAARFIGRIDDPQAALVAPTPETTTVTVSATLEDGTVYKMYVGDKLAGQQEFAARFEGDRVTSRFVVAIGEWVRSPFEVDPQNLFDPAAQSVGTPSNDGGEEGETPAPVEDPDKGNGGKL